MSSSPGKAMNDRLCETSASTWSRYSSILGISSMRMMWASRIRRARARAVLVKRHVAATLPGRAGRLMASLHIIDMCSSSFEY